MNDFTKEDLETLAKWGEVYTEFGNSWVDKTERPLIDKIQLMIDSYCDDECKHELKRQHLQIDLCEKCNSFKFVIDPK